jgi:TonB family protein
MRVTWFGFGAGLGILLAACGGSSETTETQERATAGDERPAERDDGSQITGLLGTIRPDQVNNTLEPRTEQFFGCLEPRMSEVRFLGGEVRLSFRIHVDGTVAWVYPSQSTLGDRQAERCVLEVASRARFPQPRGGEAEFSWGFAFDPPEDVRAPLAWDATRIGPALLSGAPELAQRCGVSGARVTAYVAPGGRVIAAGASAPDADSLSAIDCVIEAVQSLAMPDPGSYAAKVTFLVQ